MDQPVQRTVGGDVIQCGHQRRPRICRTRTVGIEIDLRAAGRVGNKAHIAVPYRIGTGVMGRRKQTAKIEVINQTGFLDASILGEVVTPRDFNTLKRIADEDESVIEEQESFLELASSEAR